MIFLEKHVSLSNENIKECMVSAKAEYKNVAGKRAVQTVKLGLIIEEILIRYQHTFGESAECKLIGRTRFGHIIFEVFVKGDKKECFVVEDELRSQYDILAGIGVCPRYTYSPANGGTNKAFYEHPKKVLKNKMLIQLLLALLLAVGFYCLIQVLPGQIGKTMTDILTNSVFSKICTIMSGLATFLVFFAVINGITGIGNVASFGKIGKQVCVRMIATYGVAAFALGLIGVAFYPVSFTAAEGQGGALTELVNLVLDMVPGNLLSPFVIDNDLQVIVIATFIGFTMLILGDKVTHIKTLFQECSELINKMMLIVCKLIPAVVFLGVLNLLCNSQMNQMIQLYKMVLALLAASALVVIYMIIRTCVVMKQPFKEIFKHQIPTLMINLTTASQVTAFPENMKCCKEKFGIDGKLVDFALPFGMVTYMPTGAIFLGITVWGIAIAGAIPVTPFMIIKILLVSVVVAIAAPPIPGSGIVVLPILLASCGLSAEYMSIGIIFATITSNIFPALNGFCLQLELLMCAKKLHMIKEVKSESSEKLSQTL